MEDGDRERERSQREEGSAKCCLSPSAVLLSRCWSCCCCLARLASEGAKERGRKEAGKDAEEVPLSSESLRLNPLLTRLSPTRAPRFTRLVSLSHSSSSAAQHARSSRGWRLKSGGKTMCVTGINSWVQELRTQTQEHPKERSCCRRRRPKQQQHESCGEEIKFSSLASSLSDVELINVSSERRFPSCHVMKRSERLVPSSTRSLKPICSLAAAPAEHPITSHAASDTRSDRNPSAATPY